jgi:hypothetical protein
VNEDEQWIRVDLRELAEITDVDLVAAQTKPSSLSPDPMHVTRATVVLSDGTERTVDIVEGTGRARFDAHPTDSIEVRFDEVTGTDQRPFGFSEITIDGLDLREAIELPDDLLRRADDEPELRALLENAPMTYQFSRLERLDDRAVEPTLRRSFRTVGDRPYTVRGRVDGEPLTDPESCRDVGLTIDDAQVLVRADDDAPRSFVGCEPLPLAEGRHTLRTTRDPSIRRVWLESGDRTPDPGVGTATIDDLGRSDVTVDATLDEPGVIISGQSSDDGWDATIDGNDAGEQISLDGQAAWRVDAGEHRLEAQQSSQVPYRVALVLTGLGLLLCVYLVIRGRLR